MSSCRATYANGYACDCGDLVPPTVHDLARVKRRGIFTVEIETRKVFRSNVRGLETRRNARRTRISYRRAFNDEPHPDDMPTHEVRRTVITETRPIGATEWTEHSRKTEVLP